MTDPDKMPQATPALEPASKTASRLGCHVKTIDNWVKAGLLDPPIRVQNRKFFPAGVMPKSDNSAA